MCVHIFRTPTEAEQSQKLHILTGYEDGSVALYIRTDEDRAKTIEGQGWDQLWICKEHKESGKSRISMSRLQFFWPLIDFFSNGVRTGARPHLCYIRVRRFTSREIQYAK